MSRGVMKSFRRMLASVMLVLSALGLNLADAVEAREMGTTVEKSVVARAVSERGAEGVLNDRPTRVRMWSIADPTVRLTRPGGVQVQHAAQPLALEASLARASVAGGIRTQGRAMGNTDIANAVAWTADAEEYRARESLSEALISLAVTAADHARENTEFQSIRISSIVDRDTASGIYGSNAAVAFRTGGWGNART